MNLKKFLPPTLLMCVLMFGGNVDAAKKIQPTI